MLPRSFEEMVAQVLRTWLFHKVVVMATVKPERAVGQDEKLPSAVVEWDEPAALRVGGRRGVGEGLDE